MKYLPLIRYYLEIISVPIFAWLVFHMVGHAVLMGLVPHDPLDIVPSTGFEKWYGVIENTGGVLGLIVFVWLWHRPMLKKLVPCSHDHCHHKTMWPHLLASGAFVLHWLGEAEIRNEILNNFSAQNLTDIAAAFGFASHFLVDIIVMVLLITFWSQPWQKMVATSAMLGAWGASFYLGAAGHLHLEGRAEPVVLLLSAFLLAMFVHKPHKPAPACKTCSH